MHFRHPLTAVSLALVAGAVAAAPVDSATAAADPYELAVRWTLASVAPVELPSLPATAPVAPALPGLRFGPLPHAGAVEGVVPEPAAYAAMGLLLLGAGLLARRLAGPRARPGRR